MSQDYPPTRGPVLLLTCMDLRLLDNVVYFMDGEGLTNRYDHIAIAGAALGALGAEKEELEHWRKTFKDHLDTAYKLRQFKDVIIIEHRDCGAYRELLGLDFDDDQAKQEFDSHKKYAVMIRKQINDWAKCKEIKIWVKSFLMDLRGDVDLIEGPIKVGQTSKPKKSLTKTSKKKSGRKK